MITNKQRVVACLDADSIAVIAATTNDNLKDIKETCHYMIRKWTDLAHADTCKVFLSQGKCFRYDVYEGYKGNRKGLPPIPGRKDAVKYLMDTYPQDSDYSDMPYEADDIIGLYATEPQTDATRVIVSIDKDMEQIPTWVMNPDKWRFPILITPEQALKKQMEQWLCGDSVDGYPGIKGFGPKKFEKWWQETLDLDGGEMQGPEGWEVGIVHMYKDAGLTPQTAYEQYLCATIKHHHLPNYAKCLSVKDLEALW